MMYIQHLVGAGGCSVVIILLHDVYLNVMFSYRAFGLVVVDPVVRSEVGHWYSSQMSWI